MKTIVEMTNQVVKQRTKKENLDLLLSCLVTLPS